MEILNIVLILCGQNYTILNGMAYQLKEYGVDSKMDFKEGNHRLMIRRGHLPKTIEVFENSADDLSCVLGEIEKINTIKNKWISRLLAFILNQKMIVVGIPKTLYNL